MRPLFGVWKIIFTWSTAFEKKKKKNRKKKKRGKKEERKLRGVWINSKQWSTEAYSDSQRPAATGRERSAQPAAREARNLDHNTESSRSNW